MKNKIELIRPDDLLHLSFEFTNLRIDSDDAPNPILTIDDASKDAFVIVTFPPQTIAETAYFEEPKAPISPEPPPTDPSPPPSRPLDEPGIFNSTGWLPPRRAVAKIGGLSRLAFKVPVGVTIPY